MRKIHWGKDFWVVTIYNPLVALERLSENRIRIRDWQKKDKFTYSFSSSPSQRKKILNLFKELRLVHKSGFRAYGEGLFKGKTTLLAMVIALGVFSFFSQRIDRVLMNDIKDPELQEEVSKFLEEQNISPLQIIKTDKEYLRIERDVAIQFREEIEWVEIRRHGSIISVKLRKRQALPQFPDPQKQLIATKNGLIAYFRLKSGEKKVATLDYVVKGQILVDGYLTSSTGEVTFVGCEGSVYAHTWYQVEVEQPYLIQSETDKMEAFLIAMERARGQIAQELTGDDESIEKENILQIRYEATKIIVRIHYTLLEDITR